MKKEMVDGKNYDETPNPKRNVKHMFLEKCRRMFFLSIATAGQPDCMRSYTVMYVSQCKWNQKVVVIQRSLCKYTTVYLNKSKSEVLSKLMEYLNSVEKYAGYQIMKLNILAEGVPNEEAH